MIIALSASSPMELRNISKADDCLNQLEIVSKANFLFIGIFNFLQELLENQSYFPKFSLVKHSVAFNSSRVLILTLSFHFFLGGRLKIYLEKR